MDAVAQNETKREKKIHTNAMHSNRFLCGFQLKKTAIFLWFFIWKKRFKQKSYFIAFVATCITNENWWKHNINTLSIIRSKPTCPNSVARVQHNFLNFIREISSVHSTVFFYFFFFLPFLFIIYRFFESICRMEDKNFDRNSILPSTSNVYHFT